MKPLLVLTLVALAGCSGELPLEEVTDVHVWLAEWHYDLQDDFYMDTSFRHCGDARIYGDGTGKLWWWEGEAPTELMVNQVAADSDHPDPGNMEGYWSHLNLVSPVDGHRYGVSQLKWNEGGTWTDTRTVTNWEGETGQMTESVTLTKLGAVSMHIDRNQYGCD